MTYDVVIVGGSAMGSATAYYLGLLAPELSIAVVEMDPSYEYSSTLRCDGNLRIQFNLEENIRMSLFTLSLLDSFADDMAVDGWRPDPSPMRQGNLFLVDEAGEESARQGLELQQSLGCDAVWLSAAEIEQRWPAYRTEGVVGATYGPGDGYIDPSAILHGYRRNAIRLGAEYVTAKVAAVLTKGSATAGVRLDDGAELLAAVVVNCAGGWATELAASAGVTIPVEPVMRTVFVVDAKLDTPDVPSVFLPSGLYALAEGENTFEIGWSSPEDPVGFDFDFTRSGFDDRIWPELVSVIPAFEALHVSGGWRGIYAMNTLDANAIVGEWPELSGYYMANGFSGHGFQHTPAMGRYLAELITGTAPTLDLSRLGPQRIVDGEPLYENAGRII